MAGKGRTISTVGYSLSVVEIAPGAVPSPNIWNTPQVYELENRAVDPDGVAMMIPSPVHWIRPGVPGPEWIVSARSIM